MNDGKSKLLAAIFPFSQSNLAHRKMINWMNFLSLSLLKKKNNLLESAKGPRVSDLIPAFIITLNEGLLIPVDQGSLLIFTEKEEKCLN